MEFSRSATISGVCAGALIALLLTGCERAQTPESTSTAPVQTTPAPVSTPPAARLPVSLNEVMVALVNHSADPIWRAAWRNPQTDADWRNLERMAYQLEIAGALLMIPGTGPMDEAWTANPAWNTWSKNLQFAGKRAVDAVAARDIVSIDVIGSDIVEICEGCHIQFKPDLPTGGLFGELSPTEGDFESTDDEP